MFAVSVSVLPIHQIISRIVHCSWKSNSPLANLKKVVSFQISQWYCDSFVGLKFDQKSREDQQVKITMTEANTEIKSAIRRLEKNALLAENLIAEICDKVIEIETMRSSPTTPSTEMVQLREENERLHLEVEKWKELLMIRQIRNGRKYIRTPLPRPILIKSESGQSNGPLSGSIVVSSSKVGDPSAVVKVEGQTGAKAEDTQADDSSTKKNLKQAKSKPKQEGGKAPAPTEAKKAKEPNPNQPPSVEVVDVSRLDFRVGRIIQCERHPDAESLYVEKVDVGEPNPRTVVSGLVKHIPLEEMQDRMVILLCNLKPAKMRGVTSEAMVMCASTPDKVEILIPPPGVVPGELVDFDGFLRNPDSVLNPKKKIFEAVAPDLKTNGEKVATYKGIPFTVKGKGAVTTATLLNVNIK